MMHDAITVSLLLASCTTLLLLALGVPLAWWFCFGRSRLRHWLEPLCNLPLVLPPTVLGFYLLLAFGLDREPGRWLHDTFGLQFVFSFQGLVLGSVIFSLPFMLQPLCASFRALPTPLMDAARVFGKSEAQILRQVVLPLARPGLIAGSILSFAHTLGEFGVVLMIGGNIPGETRTLSIAIYNEVERGNYSSAHQYALLLVGFAFAVLLALRLLQQRGASR